MLNKQRPIKPTVERIKEQSAGVQSNLVAWGLRDVGPCELRGEAILVLVVQEVAGIWTVGGVGAHKRATEVEFCGRLEGISSLLSYAMEEGGGTYRT